MGRDDPLELPQQQRGDVTGGGDGEDEEEGSLNPPGDAEWREIPIATGDTDS